MKSHANSFIPIYWTAALLALAAASRAPPYLHPDRRDDGPYPEDLLPAPATGH